MDLTLLGWSNFFSSKLESGLSPARVASENRGYFELWTPQGKALSRLPGTWAHSLPVTGDWVGWDPGTNVIRALVPRRTKVSRKRAGRAWEEQTLAANVDVLFLVTALDHDFNIRRLERYLITARESGASPVIVLNKADLCEDSPGALREVDRAAPGLPTVLMSALDGSGTAQLQRYVEPGQTAALLGSSGAGKSTIVNRLLGSESQVTRPVREFDSRGRHTTSSRQLFLLEEGWLLMDTPGLRELDPWAGTSAAAEVFDDIAREGAKCRFRDCRHSGEPGCAVEAAIEAGTLDRARLDSFHKLQAGLWHMERMTNVHAAQEEKRKWKVIHKAMRHHPKQ